MPCKPILLVLAAGSLLVTGCSDEEPAPSDEAAQGVAVTAPVAQEAAELPIEEGAVDELPVRLSGPDIVYPEQLRHDGIEGHVLLSAVVGADGSVEAGSVTVDSSTHAAFEAAAVAWLAEATFTPGTVDGAPVRVRITLPVAFKLAPQQRS